MAAIAIKIKSQWVFLEENSLNVLWEKKWKRARERESVHERES